MTIIKVKQSIIDKVRYLRRAVYEKGRKYVRSVSLQDSNVACLHTRPYLLQATVQFTTVSKVELVGMPWCL